MKRDFVRAKRSRTSDRSSPKASRVSDLGVRFAKDARDLAAIVELEKRVFKDPTNLMRTDYAEEWINKFSMSFSTMLDPRGRTWGFARCIPVSEAAYRRMLHPAPDVRDHLRPENVLTDFQVLSNAIEGIGNYCNVGMVVYDASREREDYGEISRPLLRKLAEVLRQIRVRALVCQSENDAERNAIEKSGCTKAYDAAASEDGTRTVWYFDHEVSSSPFDGLGVLFTEIWPSKQEKPSLGLSDTEKKVLLLTSWDKGPGEVNKLLRIADSTRKKHLENAREKFKVLARDHRVKRVKAEMVIDYCRCHPVEWFKPKSHGAGLKVASDDAVEDS